MKAKIKSNVKAFAPPLKSDDTFRINHFFDFGPSSRLKYPLPQTLC